MFYPTLAKALNRQDFSTPATSLWFDFVEFAVRGSSLIGVSFWDGNILGLVGVPHAACRETILKHSNSLKLKTFVVYQRKSGPSSPLL